MLEEGLAVVCHPLHSRRLGHETTVGVEEESVSAVLGALDRPAARPQLFNICMDEPGDYRLLADYLHETRGRPSVDVPTPFHRTWLDNSKAKFLLDWRPEYDLAGLIDAAWAYQREDDDPRKVWYPG